MHSMNIIPQEEMSSSDLQRCRQIGHMLGKIVWVMEDLKCSWQYVWRTLSLE